MTNITKKEQSRNKPGKKLQLKKETIKDLSAKRKGQDVQGGARPKQDQEPNFRSCGCYA